MIRTVYVRLLDEGTLVFRPTSAEFLSENTARLLPVPGITADDEEWEFAPGSVVRIEERKLSEAPALVAVSVVR